MAGALLNYSREWNRSTLYYLGLDEQNEAAQAKVLAERGAGMCLITMREGGELAGRGESPMRHAATLDSIGVDRTVGSRWQRLARIPGKLFHGKIVAAAMLAIDKRFNAARQRRRG